MAIVAAQVRRLPLGRTFWYVPHGPVLDYDVQGGDRLRAVAIGLREAARRDRAMAVKLEPRLELGQRRSSVPSLAPRAATLQLARPDWWSWPTTKRCWPASTRTRATPCDAPNGRASPSPHSTMPATCGRSTISTALVLETQRRAGFPKPPLQRYRTAWRGMASAGRAVDLRGAPEEQLLASGMLVIVGDRSFYLFAGSLREEKGEPKRYASYLLQWAMMRHARDAGARVHDLWGIAPEGATAEHPWYGVGLFKKGFGGRPVMWAGTWDIVVDPTLYRMRQMGGGAGWWRARARVRRKGR